MKPAVKKTVIGGLIWAGFMLALTFGASFAHRLGYIDRDTVTRLVSGFLGLWVAWSGNRIPKIFSLSAQTRRVQRIAAWSQVLGGLFYAGLWAFAPIPVAIKAGIVVILASMAVAFGSWLTLPGRTKAS